MNKMYSRNFIQLSTLNGVGLSFAPMLTLASRKVVKAHSPEFRKLVFDLLKDWCDGMIDVQVINRSGPGVHGMLDCPACDTVHARFMDAVYPFMYMAIYKLGEVYNQQEAHGEDIALSPG